MKKLRVGLIGFGTVGQAVYRMLQDSSEVNAEVTAICVKDRTKPRSLPQDRFTYDWREVIANPAVDTIIEVTGDVSNAYQLTIAALSVGKPVVSANKRMLALNLASLRELSGRTGMPLLYEGSTCAGVPVISVLENHHAALALDSITGVFNASSQFVLSEIESGRGNYDEAVRITQQAGWAELDPTLDMAGFDTTFKLCILAAHGFGTFINPDDVVRFGIEGVSSEDIRFARRLGCRIKLVAHARREGNRLAAWVLPELVPPTSKLYPLDGEEAAVLIEADSFGYHLAQGKGAGGFVTGSAILADLKALAAGYAYSYHKANSGIELASGRDVSVDIIIRADDPRALRSLRVHDLVLLESDEPFQYARAQVRLADLQSDSFKQEGLFVVHLPASVSDEVDNRLAESVSVRK